MAYGDYDLSLGDRDSDHRYGGVVRPASTGDILPGPGESGFVLQLQRDLIALGFLLVGKADGDFGRKTEWAVRQYQAYAKMATVAVETGSASRYVDRLGATPNTTPYGGPVSGVANAETRSRIQQWLANDWRCPVVVEAWNMAGGSPSSLQKENVWGYDEVTDKSARIFARDFSGYYDLPAGHDPDDLISLGRYVTYLSWSGPLSDPPRLTWRSAEILPDTLIGADLASLSPAQLSTFKVVRAVSEVECIGFFDCLNCYDNAFVSGGPCHWTLGIVDKDGNMSEGELCGYLSYLRHADAAAFEKAIGHFGVKVDEDWDGSGVPTGSVLFDSSSRKYVGWLALQRDDGSYQRLPEREDLGNLFKGWHWFYRFAMAGRTVDGWRRRMWDMARVRLRDIRATPFPAGILPDIDDGAGGLRRARVGDVYTSEKALAVLLRFHIRFPAFVIAGGQAGTRLRSAFARAAIPGSAGPPATWTGAHEDRLLDGLIEEIENIGNDGLIETIEYVREWPRWATGDNPRGFQLSPTIGALNESRNGFQFEGSSLPPPPY